MAPTSIDVARAAGVSQSTVSRAFSTTTSVAPETRKLIYDAAESLGYRPNAIARSLITRQTGIIAVVIETLTDPFYSLILSELSYRLQSLGRQLMLLIVPEGTTADDVLTEALEYKVDAVVVTSAVVTSNMAEIFASRGVPMVLFNRYVPALKADAVSCDNVGAGRVVAKFLIGQGHTRLAFVAGCRHATTSLDRERGFVSELKRSGLKLHAKAHANFSYDAAYSVVSAMVTGADAPDAIFFASDVMALAGVDAIRTAGRGVPDDISIVGFDDIAAASWAPYRLTTVRQPIPQMVNSVLRKLGLVTAPALTLTHKIKASLIERESTRPRTAE